MDFRCKNCRFWVSAVDQPRNGQTLKDGEGECHRMIAVMYPWPIAHENDWCGEFVTMR